MLILYMSLQLISLVLIVINSFDDIVFLNIFKFVPILLNLLFCFRKTVDAKLRLALFFTVIADACFLFMNNHVLGISFLVLVQLLYYSYINKSNNKMLIILPIANILLALLLVGKVLYLEVSVYVILLLINIVKTFILAKNDKNCNLMKASLILLLLCGLCAGIKLIFNLNKNMDVYIGIFACLFYIPSQILLVIYALNLNDAFLYRLLQPVFRIIFNVYYNPTIVNKEYIPKSGSSVIAGNHKHALDPILVDASTTRVVHTLAKKELHDGIFGWFFRAIGTIPVDLHAEHNKEALNSAIDYLNDGHLVNLSPEAKRNYTKEILLPFKFGAVVMAKRTNSKIVPYFISGDYKFRSKNLKIVFGKPLDISNLSVEEANDLLYKKVKKLALLQLSE